MKRKTYIRTPEHRKLMSQLKMGKTYGEEWKKKISEHHADVSGKNNPMWGKKHAESVKEAVRKANWKGGRTAKTMLARCCYAYLKWRKDVFSRDNYTCVICGAHTGNGHRVTLNADHIKPFSLFPELRYELSNGRTLCVDCHKKTESFGANVLRKEYCYAQQ